jgi:hypothetical protein
MGYSFIFERDLFLEFNKGILVGSREADNTKTFNPDEIVTVLTTHPPILPFF